MPFKCHSGILFSTNVLLIDYSHLGSYQYVKMRLQSYLPPTDLNLWLWFIPCLQLSLQPWRESSRDALSTCEIEMWESIKECVRWYSQSPKKYRAVLQGVIVSTIHIICIIPDSPNPSLSKLIEVDVNRVIHEPRRNTVRSNASASRTTKKSIPQMSRDNGSTHYVSDIVFRYRLSRPAMLPTICTHIQNQVSPRPLRVRSRTRRTALTSH